MQRLQATGAEILEKGIDTASMSFAAVISTSDVDRVGDSLLSRGCMTEAYRYNPVVFLNHESEKIPLGVSVDDRDRLYVVPEENRVLARCFCVQGGRWGQDAADIFHLIVERAFNDVSVGFNPHPDPRYAQRLETGGTRYEKWELLEWSPVGIGCNRAAKIIRKYLSDGHITGKSLSPQLVKCLTPLAEPKSVQAVGGFDAAAAKPVAKNSFFAECPRDEQGHCQTQGQSAAAASPPPAHAPSAGATQEHHNYLTSEQIRGRAGDKLEELRDINRELQEIREVLGAPGETSLQARHDLNERHWQLIEARQNLLGLNPHEVASEWDFQQATQPPVKPRRRRNWVKAKQRKGASVSKTLTEESPARQERPAEFNASGRRDEAESGVARQDGSFPIRNEQDLKDAVRDIGRAKDPEGARRHIIERARKLHLESLLPADWDKSTGEKKSLTSSSGTEGGYAVGEGDPHARTREGIAEVMDRHREGDADYQEAHFKAETGEVHHVASDSATPEHLAAVRDDLSAIEGVHGVHQEAESGPPEGSGYERVYPRAENDEAKNQRLARMKAQLAYHLGRGSAYQSVKLFLTKEKQDALETCVQHKIPTIARDHPDMADEQRVAVAYSMCGESKGFFKEMPPGAYAHKDAADGNPDAPAPAPPPPAPVPQDTSAAQQPPSLELCQQAIENIEASLPGLEPETRSFWEDILEQIRTHGQERYPDEEFGGDKAAASAGDAAADRAQAEAVVEAYRRTPEGAEKRAQAAAQKSLAVLRKGDHPEVMANIAGHLHQIADTPLGHTFSKAEKMLSREHARSMDRLCGAVTTGIKAETEVPASPGGEKPGKDRVDESEEAIEKLFASFLSKATPTAAASEEDAARLERLSAKMTSLFGQRF